MRCQWQRRYGVKCSMHSGHAHRWMMLASRAVASSSICWSAYSCRASRRCFVSASESSLRTTLRRITLLTRSRSILEAQRQRQLAWRAQPELANEHTRTCSPRSLSSAAQQKRSDVRRLALVMRQRSLDRCAVELVAPRTSASAAASTCWAPERIGGKGEGWIDLIETPVRAPLFDLPTRPSHTRPLSPLRNTGPRAPWSRWRRGSRGTSSSARPPCA